MQESYKEDLANHFGLDPYAVGGDSGGVALVRGNAGQPWSSEITSFVCRSCPVMEKATPSLPQLARYRWTRRSRRTCACVDIPSARTGRSHGFPLCHGTLERPENAAGGTADMHARGKSDGPIVPAKRTNKTGTPVAEPVEERGSPKGSAASSVLAPDTVPGFARHRRSQPRLVEMCFLIVVPKGGAV